MDKKNIPEQKEDKKLKSIILLIMAIIASIVTLTVIIIGVKSGEVEKIPLILFPMILSLIVANILILRNNKN